MRNDVLKRLESLEYIWDPTDTADYWMINFLIEKVTNAIKNECNVSDIPEGLYHVAVDMVCGEFLANKKSAGALDGFAVDLSKIPIKQVANGDTNVVFAVESVTSPEKGLDRLIDYLLNFGKSEFVTYRKIKWI